MIQARVIQENSDFGVKLATVQFYTNEHNFQSNHWIRLKFCERFPDMSIYLWSKCQVNRSSRSHYISSRNLLWKFCYILPFDLWTSYLVRILFLPLKGYSAAYFRRFPSSTRTLNEGNKGGIEGRFGMEEFLFQKRISFLIHQGFRLQ